jgi:uncharacterized protein (DUF1778 family)
MVVKQVQEPAQFARNLSGQCHDIMLDSSSNTEENPMATSSHRSEKLDIRITPEAKRILQEAAKQRHITISQFVLESALDSASAVLAERSRLGLNAEQWEAFLAALDAPPRRHPRMERLLNEPTLLD